MIRIYNQENKPSFSTKNEIIDFLFINLEEYGDDRKDIKKCMEYALKEIESFGGFIMTISEGDELAGATIFNKTGMGGYIPENILVYIATNKKFRGKGYGKKLITEAIQFADGDVALHVEAKNPAINLYEKIGFTNPYLEMRLKK